MTRARENRPSILFVCRGNTCRSLMAEALARARFGGAARFESAGLAPQSQEDARSAVEALSRLGIDASGHVPRNVRSLDLAAFSRVVAMDPDVARGLGALTDLHIEVWAIEDPWGGGAGRYQRCVDEIGERLAQLPVLDP